VDVSYNRKRQASHYVTRIVEFEGERWRVTAFDGQHATLDFVNDPTKPRRDDILNLSRKTFFECLLPRIVTPPPELQAVLDVMEERKNNSH